MVSLQAGLQEETTSCGKNTLKRDFNSCKKNRQVMLLEQPAGRHPLPVQQSMDVPLPDTTPTGCPQPQSRPPANTAPSFFGSKTSSQDPTFNTALQGHGYTTRAQICASAKWALPPFPRPFPDIATTHKIKELIQIKTNSVLNLYIYQSLSPWVFSWLRSPVLARETLGDGSVRVTPVSCRAAGMLN